VPVFDLGTSAEGRFRHARQSLGLHQIHRVYLAVALLAPEPDTAFGSDGHDPVGFDGDQYPLMSRVGLL
jgi:hypothetical protein